MIDRKGVVFVTFDRRADGNRDAPLAVREGIVVRNILTKDIIIWH